MSLTMIRCSCLIVVCACLLYVAACTVLVHIAAIAMTASSAHAIDRRMSEEEARGMRVCTDGLSTPTLQSTSQHAKQREREGRSGMDGTTLIVINLSP